MHRGRCHEGKGDCFSGWRVPPSRLQAAAAFCLHYSLAVGRKSRWKGDGAMKRVAVVLGVLAVVGFAYGQTVERVSVSSAGVQGDGASDSVSLSADGRYVAFGSSATNLVPGDTNGKKDIFVRDRVTGHTVRVSVDGSGAELPGDSARECISGDGRYVAYTYYNPADSTQKMIHIYDRQTGQVGTVGSFSSSQQYYRPQLSDDGRYVLYGHGVKECGMGWCEWHYSRVWKDRQTSETKGFGYANASMSGDGRYVVYDTDASYLFRYDTQTDEVVECGPGYNVVVNRDGQYIAFTTSLALDPADTDALPDIYRKDLQTGEVILCSVQEETGRAEYGSISPGGRYVGYEWGPSGGPYPPHFFDTQTGENACLIMPLWGGAIEGSHSLPEFCDDPSIVGFAAEEGTLVLGDTNGEMDVFVCHLDGPQPVGLVDGWNLIGYLRPYHEATLLANCEIDDGSSVMSWDDAVTAGLVQAMLYCYEEGAGYTSLATSGADDDHFRSGCGYWLLNESGAELILRIPW